MKTKTKLFLHRIFLYIRALYFQNFKHALSQYAVTSGIFILMTALWTIGMKFFIFGFGLPIGIFSFLHIVYTFIVLLSVSKVFQEFHNKKTFVLAFTVPASSLEKYIGLFIFYFLLHVILVMFIIFLSALGMYMFMEIILKGHNSFGFEQALTSHGRIFSEYMTFSKYVHFLKSTGILFGYFFAGAVFFRQNQFLKTVFLGISTSIVLLLPKFFVEFRFISLGKPMLFLYSLYENVVLAHRAELFVIGAVIVVIIGYFRFAKMPYR